MTPNRRYCPTHLHITSTTGDCPVCGEQTNPFDADNGRSEVQAILKKNSTKEDTFTVEDLYFTSFVVQ